MKTPKIASAVAALLMTTVYAHGLDTGVYYRLYTQFRGPGLNLDTFTKDNLTHLAGRGNYSGQYWRLVPAGNGYYRLTTQFLGPNMCLDIFNGGPNNNQPQLRPCGNYSGQFWKLRREGGWYRLTTQFRGSNMCLDIFNGGPNNNQPELRRCGNYSGQFWKLEPTNSPASVGGLSTAY